MDKNRAARYSAGWVLGLLGVVLVHPPALQALAAEDRPILAVETAFEGGSGLVQAVDQETRLIRLVPTPHKDRGWACWWFVRVTGIRPGETITLDVGDGPWATPDRAMVSLDRRTWQHTEPGKRSGKRIRYRPTIDAREAWFAWGPPLLPSDAAELVRASAAQCPHAKAFELCRSREGRPVPALRVEEPARQDSRRLGIWVGARQHAWESGSSWVCRGLVEWLVSDDARAAALRKKALVVVVPIMDVDNVAIGAGGKEQKPHDHNRDWSDNPYFPAVAAAQREIRRLDAAGTLDLYLDLHNPAANDLVPFFFVPHRQAWPDPAWESLQRFLAAARAEIAGPLAYAGMLRQTGPAYDRQWQTISDHWVRRNTRPQVLTLSLETPWNTPHSTPEGYLRIGRQLGLAIERYFSAGSGK